MVTEEGLVANSHYTRSLAISGMREAGRPLTVEPNFIFLDEDWSLEKQLSVSICSDNIDKVQIISGNDDNRFSVVKTNQTCGTLKLNKPLDADQLHSDGTRWQSFSLLFSGSKKGRRASLDIQVVDVNDNIPKFMNWRSEVNVSEKLSIGSVIQRIQTFDPDTGVGGIVRFFSDSEKFSIENERCSNSYCHADLVLKSPLDYESNSVERVSVVARDGASLTKHTNEAVATVTVNVVDEQDTPPTFLTTVSEPIKIVENLAIGSKVLQVNAVDGDRYTPKKNEINYELVGKSDYFQIDPVSGAVILKKKLDRETDPQITLVIMAVELDDVRMSSEMTVEFIVEDANDNPPQCSSHKYGVQLNRITKKLKLDKPITGKHARFDIELSGEFSESFSIKPKKVQGTADLLVTVADFESLEYVTDPEIILELNLIPRDSENPVSPTKCLIVVQLDSIVQKNTPQVFRLKQEVFNVQLMENMPAPQILVNITDPSEHDIVYTIEGTGATLFSINDDSQFIASEALDAEDSRSYDLKITANQGGQIAVAKIHVTVLDQNDNEPVFEKPHYIFNITEETEATFHMKATDFDSPANARITYKILPPAPEGTSINEKTGRITIGKIDIDKLGSPEVKFTVMANDNGEPPLNSTTSVTLNVGDLNDNIPFFAKRAYSVILNCRALVNSTVVKVKALDMDLTGSKIRYELPGEMQNFFHVDPVTGVIVLAQELPKTRKELHFNVIARDNGRPPKQAVTRVTVRISDCVDEEENQIIEEIVTTTIPSPTTTTSKRVTKIRSEATTRKNIIEEKSVGVVENKSFNKLEGSTRVFIPKHLTASIEENSPVGTKVIGLDLNNETSKYDFHFTTHDADQTKFMKMNKNGELKVAENIDYEKTRVINGSIFARFNKRNLLYSTITVSIIDKNDNKPIFRLPKNYAIQVPIGAEVGHVLDLPYPLATDQDISLGYSTIAYEMKENNSKSVSCFKIDRNSSIIQLVKPVVSCSMDKVYLFIQATDNPNGNLKERNIVNHTLIVEITKDPISTTPASQNMNLSSDVFKSLPSEISVFEDESIGSVLLVISSDEIGKIATENSSISDTSKMSIELTVRNSDLVELANGSELRLRKSLKGYVNQKLCVQVEAKLDSNSMVPQVISKTVCLVIKPRPRTPIIFFPTQNSVHKFKENTKYENLFNFNASSTILDPKLSGLKYGILETKNDDWKDFTIDSRGVLKAKNEFDFEKKDKYNLQVQVCDFNDSCTDVQFRIQVEDLNDHCPSFSHKFEVFEIPENQPVGTEGAVVGEFTSAEDADGTTEKRSICYKLEEEKDSVFFLPDNRKSTLFVKKSLDREEISQYNITVIAMDCHFKERDLNCTEGNPKGSYKKLLIVNVADLNDNFPKFSQKEYYGKVIERKTKFGEKILKVEALDPDIELRGLHYSMSSAVRTESDVIPREEAPFHIDSKTGEIISHVIYSSKMPHSYNFRVVVKDGADHEDEASVTISVINYNEQVELVFDQPEEVTRKNQREISKLMFDITSMYFVIDDISGHGNSTNILAHFLEKDKLLASAAKALTIFEESKTEQAQRARHELRRAHALKKIFSDNSEPDLINSVFNSSLDGYTVMIGSVFTVICLLLFLLVTYLCCHRQNKSSGKLNCAAMNQDLIFGNGTSAPGIGLQFPKTSGAGLVGTMTLPSAQRTATLNHPQRQPQSNHQPPPPGALREDLLNSQETQMFDALQSTEL
ncbi:hypothetical protein FO519_003553 [Halicephalobus sp. NKZ332]|nr:hypothetical protein FO519_003553 [Halicephalobus sp. NKZ332]